MTKYNGFKNWNHWNVSLWIQNDYPLYNTARLIRRKHKNVKDAAQAMKDILDEMGLKKTPDGAPYSASSLRCAMLDL
jgi:hypothetical protein